MNDIRLGLMIVLIVQFVSMIALTYQIGRAC